MVRFAGAPAAPDPASIYEGLKIILVKTDGAKFPNGDSWKCVTCGVPAQNAVGTNDAWDYPQSFHDGRRILAGTNIIDCLPFRAGGQAMHCRTSSHLSDSLGSSGRWFRQGRNIRELRLHPDDIHLGFNSIPFHEANLINSGILAVLNSTRRLNPVSPLAPRYELVHVSRLFQRLGQRVLTVDQRHPDELRVNLNAIEVANFAGSAITVARFSTLISL